MILTDEQMMIQNSARRFAQERLLPHSLRWENESGFDAGIFEELGAMGFMSIVVPEEWGGSGADYVSYAMMMEELAAGDGAISTIVSAQNWLASFLAYGTEKQKQKYMPKLVTGKALCAFCLSEPGSGSDASAMKTRARRDGDGYVISGTKQFVTSGAIANVAIVFAVTDPDAGKKGISAFLVETTNPGYRIAKIEKKMGQNASDTCEVLFDDAVVPADALLGSENEGYRIALANLESGRIGIAAQCVGMARASLEIATAYAQDRRTFGKAIFEHQAVAFRLADMKTQLEASRQLVLHAAARKSAGLSCLTEASMAKLFASEAAERICSDAMQTLGGAGYIEDCHVERICRAVRVAKIYEGTSDIQKMVISRSLAI